MMACTILPSGQRNRMKFSWCKLPGIVSLKMNDGFSKNVLICLVLDSWIGTEN